MTLTDPISEKVAMAEDARCAAMVVHDAITLAKLLHDEFTYCTTSGSVHSKQGLLKRIAGDELSYIKIDTLERNITRRGPVLFAVGRVYVETQSRGEGVENRVLRFTSIYSDEREPLCLALFVSPNK